MTRPDDRSRPVYSTEGGRLCPDCSRPLSDCACRGREAARPLGNGQVRVSRERQGRGGKTVTLVRGLPLATAELADLGKRLRSACGTGGTVRDGVLELQGDHRDRVVEWLRQAGHPAKAAGG